MAGSQAHIRLNEIIIRFKIADHLNSEQPPLQSMIIRAGSVMNVVSPFPEKGGMVL